MKKDPFTDNPREKMLETGRQLIEMLCSAHVEAFLLDEFFPPNIAMDVSGLVDPREPDWKKTALRLAEEAADEASGSLRDK